VVDTATEETLEAGLVRAIVRQVADLHANCARLVVHGVVEAGRAAAGVGEKRELAQRGRVGEIDGFESGRSAAGRRGPSGDKTAGGRFGGTRVASEEVLLEAERILSA
jgi:hypothetical protein